MYKFVIFSNDIELIKKFNNIICDNFCEIHLSNIVSTKDELASLCETNKINTIILSLSDSKNNSLLPLLSNIENKIIVCDDTTGLKNSKYTSYFSYNASEESIEKRLCKLNYKVSERVARKKAIKQLEMFHFNFKLRGTTYLLESIVYSYLTKDKYTFENLEKNVYPYVSKKYNVSAQNIKWSIIRSINNMKKACALKSYHIDFPGKITPKYMIPEIVNRL